jgi:predicted RNase H-like nuclease (RuvC/YqgF family)
LRSAKLAGVESDRERAEASWRAAEAKAHKAENEIKEKRERIRQLKRDLEDAERRAEHGIRRAKTLEQVRARVHALETAVATEVTRVTALESSIRVGAG